MVTEERPDCRAHPLRWRSAKLCVHGEDGNRRSLLNGSVSVSMPRVAGGSPRLARAVQQDFWIEEGLFSR